MQCPSVTISRLRATYLFLYDDRMQSKYNKRALQLARSIDHRLKRLPRFIRREFRTTADRQSHALRSVEQAMSSLAAELREFREEREH